MFALHLSYATSNERCRVSPFSHLEYTKLLIMVGDVKPFATPELIRRICVVNRPNQDLAVHVQIYHFFAPFAIE
jgi:hypothetical protein